MIGHIPSLESSVPVLPMCTQRLVYDGNRLWPPVEDCLDWSTDKSIQVWFLWEWPCLGASDTSHTQPCVFSTYCTDGYTKVTYTLYVMAPDYGCLWRTAWIGQLYRQIHPGYCGSVHVWGPVIHHITSIVSSVPIEHPDGCTQGSM